MIAVRALLVVCALTCAAPLVHAQSPGFARDLNLTLTPAYPEPGQTVQLSVQTFSLDLHRSNVSWFIDRKEVARGVGLTTASITAGGLGSETEILVVAEDEDGVTATAGATIRPTELDLVWEADSYTPPFYAGRVFPGTQSPVRAQAFARFKTKGGTMVPDKDIVYTWYKNGAIAAEGRGKSSVTVPGPALFSTDTLQVVAVSADKTLSAEASVRIPSIDPFLMLYENHPLFGILYHRSLEPGATTLETEQKVTAVPYFADIAFPGETALEYEWTVNGTRIEPDPREPQTLTITANGYSGPIDVALTLMSDADIFLRALGSWQIVFGETSSIFGRLNPFSRE